MEASVVVALRVECISLSARVTKPSSDGGIISGFLAQISVSTPGYECCML